MSPALPARPSLHLVTDRRLCPLDRLPDVVGRAIAGGVNAVHLREPDVPAGALYEAACGLREVCHNRAMLIVHDRLDVALAAGAGGVQLGEHGLPVSVVRRLAGGRLAVGRSVHSAEAAVAAADAGADFVVVGTIYSSRSHPGTEPAGTTLLRAVSARVGIPIIGIGGISPDNAAAVVAAGAFGVAVISSILAAPDVEGAARALRRAMDYPGAEHESRT